MRRKPAVQSINPLPHCNSAKSLFEKKTALYQGYDSVQVMLEPIIRDLKSQKPSAAEEGASE
jgi:hypothetical protein